ncbi:MAG: hypothetical protein K2Q15_13430 [Burkholderiales bacterium]|nr:hypothetical protein [Burkholderiales bacterium]MCX7204476.1 hypothetical protein [Pseudomonadota bacterium]
MARARETDTSLRAFAMARLLMCLLFDLEAVFFTDLFFTATLFVFDALALVAWLVGFFADDFVTVLWSVFAAAKAGAVRPSAATRVQQEKMRYSMR